LADKRSIAEGKERLAATSEEVPHLGGTVHPYAAPSVHAECGSHLRVSCRTPGRPSRSAKTSHF